MRTSAAVLPLLAALVLPGPAAASPPEDLDAFLPTALRDATLGDPGGAEVQAGLRYDRRRGRDELLLLPQVEFNPTADLQLSLGVPYVAGSGSRSNQGQVSVGAFHRLAREAGLLPDLAVAVDAGAPIGPGDRATELALTGIASRSLDRDGRRRLHLNATWQRRFAPSEDERRHGYRLVAGYSEALGRDTVLVVDYLRERQDRGERDANVVEVGLRRRLATGVTLGVGLGAGIGADSPRFRALLSLEIDL